MSRPAVLLANADWAATLAAVRELGRDGVEVIVADDSPIACSRFSRHAARFVRCPPVYDPRFLDWVLELGRRRPGRVLLPTSDSLSYLYARHADALARDYRLSVPSVSSVLAVLDKQRLYQAARAAGLATPATWFPADDHEVATIAAGHPGPLLVKSRTHALSSAQSKGVLVRDPAALAAVYRRFAATRRFAPALLHHHAELARPMLQAYHDDAERQIYLLAGFIDASGERFAARAALKVLQWPRRLGIGLCFEDAAVDPALAEGVRRMCRAVGYHGLFQLEFIRTGGRALLIDFNPRFYHPLALDIARGMSLPRMVYSAACGDQTGLRALTEAAAAPPAGAITALCNGFGLEVLLAAQRWSGEMSPGQAAAWRGWREQRGERCLDTFVDRADPWPARAHKVGQLYNHARHPRSFLRAIVFNR